MDRLTLTVESFRATIAYGFLALAGVLAAALCRGSDWSVKFALAAMAAAYLSQSFVTHGAENNQNRDYIMAVVFQFLSVAFFVLSALNL